jgi:hypothetical protein
MAEQPLNSAPQDSRLMTSIRLLRQPIAAIASRTLNALNTVGRTGGLSGDQLFAILDPTTHKVGPQMIACCLLTRYLM